MGQLLEDARERAGLSQNQAAKAVGISGTRWRQIVKGVGAHGVPVRGADKTVAAMAQLVGVRPDQLRKVDRSTAAVKLEALIGAEDAETTDGDSSNENAGLRALEQRIAAQQQELAELRERLSQLEREKSPDKG